uniref:Uncharacterized protein n=1 Tax=Anguilla anguilla TaxID=7936 RepID=A0A0E9WAQ1_ANGAN
MCILPDYLKITRNLIFAWNYFRWHVRLPHSRTGALAHYKN